MSEHSLFLSMSLLRLTGISHFNFIRAQNHMPAALSRQAQFAWQIRVSMVDKSDYA
jgi:hypothetical protein